MFLCNDTSVSIQCMVRETVAHKQTAHKDIGKFSLAHKNRIIIVMTSKVPCNANNIQFLINNK